MVHGCFLDVGEVKIEYRSAMALVSDIKMMSFIRRHIKMI